VGKGKRADGGETISQSDALMRRTVRGPSRKKEKKKKGSGVEEGGPIWCNDVDLSAAGGGGALALQKQTPSIQNGME